MRTILWLEKLKGKLLERTWGKWEYHHHHHHVPEGLGVFPVP